MISKENAFATYLYGMLFKMIHMDTKITTEEKKFMDKNLKNHLGKNFDFEIQDQEFKKNDQENLDLVVSAAKLISIREAILGAKIAIKVALMDAEIDENEKSLISTVFEKSKIPKRHCISLFLAAKREIDSFNLKIKVMQRDEPKASLNDIREKLISIHFYKDGITECPRCENLYMDTFEQEQVEMDYCASGCHGVWMDKGEVSIYISEEEERLPFKEMDIRSGKLIDLKCPRCDNQSLYEHSHFEQSLVLDHCPECQGVWFDGQELGKLSRLSNDHSLGGKLKVLRKLEK